MSFRVLVISLENHTLFNSFVNSIKGPDGTRKHVWANIFFYQYAV